ncbi:hypothetical protein TRP8649_01502 [Pelagimonas phthalicica]|uniref:Peptidase M23 n=1 Tax=Pelagimonas phthalicica TaxID=1037362 RepID=A0A238JB68_9RHOB|nr:hypothetical protein [Pelagimonas phthalicica]TDS94077.1 hypothetical protein CLV87_0570 [Pelagimonas phthalicica]SMX27397.1 hypothetical protein TRP8649_01502 [Pelagimonas phthalicica]
MMRSAFALVVMAGPALAHEGAHLHPHDGGMWLGVVAVLAGLGVIAYKVMR